jgi:hypothetical protein
MITRQVPRFPGAGDRRAYRLSHCPDLSPASPYATLPRVRAHSTGFFAVTTPSSRSPSPGCAPGKASTPPRSLVTFSTRTHDNRPLKKRLPSASMAALTRRALRFRRPHRDTPPGRPGPSSPVGFPDHSGVQPCAGHHRKALAVQRSGVQPTTIPVQADLNCLGEIGWDIQVGRQQIRCAGRQDRKDVIRPGHRRTAQTRTRACLGIPREGKAVGYLADGELEGASGQVTWCRRSRGPRAAPG